MKEKTDRKFLDRMLKKHAEALEGVVKAYTRKVEKHIPIHPEYVASVLDELADDDAVFTVDTGMCNVWAARYLTPNGKRRVIGSFSHGSMANALPQAIGAQFTDRNRQVVSMSGDGGFTMLMGDFLTLVQYDLPVKVVLFNNSSLGMVELEMLVAGLPSFGTSNKNPDFAAVARACGAYGVRVEKPKQLEGALKEAFKHKGPALVDVVTDPNALSIPPKISAEMVTGFALSASKIVLDGEWAGWSRWPAPTCGTCPAPERGPGQGGSVFGNRHAGVRRSVRIWNGRSDSTRPCSSVSASCNGRSSRSVTWARTTGNPTRSVVAGAAARRLVEPHDHIAAAVLGELHRLHRDRRMPGVDQRRQYRRHRRPQRQIEREPFPNRVGDPAARRQRVPEPVPAEIGLRVGAARGAQQRQPYGRAEARRVRGPGHVVSVRRVVEQCHAVPRLGDPQPPMGADLETGGVPAGVVVRGAVDMAELDLGGGPFGVHIQRERRLEDLLRLPPVDLGLDVDPTAAGAQPDLLCDM